MDSLSDNYAYVVMDNEAGMEHLSRRTTRATDTLFVVSDASKAALQAAVRIASLAQDMDLDIGRTVLVRNMAPSPDQQGSATNEGFDATYSVRPSAAIRTGSLESESILGIPELDPAYQDVAAAVDHERRLAKR